MRPDAWIIEALELLDAAERDERYADQIGTDEMDFEGRGFHLQQAVEKYLKALLLLHRARPPYSHDIDRLLLQLDDIGVETTAIGGASALNHFAVRLRYIASTAVHRREPKRP